MRKTYTKDIRDVVIKVGTSVLTTRGRFDQTIITRLAGEISDFIKKGQRVFIVSSGAIGAGMTLLKETERPRTMEGLQTAAAVGQRYLMQCYEGAFSDHGLSTAQILLTWDDVAMNRRSISQRSINAKRTLMEIQRRGLVPIINENDTVATDEIRFGDNDRLSSLLSILVEADLLVILSDTDGLRDGNGERVPEMGPFGKMVFSHVKDKKNPLTVGGMRSKLEAIQMSTSSGIPVFLEDGRQKNVLKRFISGEPLGTFFRPAVDRMHAKKNWSYYFSNHVRSHDVKKRAFP